MHRPALGHLSPKLAALELDTDQLPADAFGPELLERGLPDVVLRLLLHQALQAHHVKRGVPEVDV